MNNRWTPTERRDSEHDRPDLRQDTGWREYDAPEQPYQGGHRRDDVPPQQPHYDDGHRYEQARYEQAPRHSDYGRTDYYAPEQPQYEQPQYDQQHYDQPQYEQPDHGQQQYDEPRYDHSGYAQPQHRQPEYDEHYDEPPRAQHYDDHYGVPADDSHGNENGRYEYESSNHDYDRAEHLAEPQHYAAAEPDPEPVAAAVPPRTRSRSRRAKATARKKRGRAIMAIAAAVVLLFGAAVAYAAVRYFDRPEVAADFTGAGGDDVIVQVKDGDTADQIATEMASKGVTASASAFFEAAVKNTAMNGVQPGFYSVPSKVPAAKAVAALVDPSSRVGEVVLSEGRQLHDSSDVKTGATKEGIYRKIAAASCINEGATKKCVSYDDLNAAGASTDLASLGVPDWAADNVRKVPDRDRQLEGLIAAGSLNFDPSLSAKDILKQLVTDSTSKYEQTGILNSDKADGNLSPYQKLTAASLVERESLPQDFGKVARVIVNRLAVNQPLQFDSTVNYSLDQTEVATTDADRQKVTPWNTYASPGLPATPISAPSIDALKAVEAPTPGNFLYFVTIDNQGTTLFTDNYDEHLRNIERANDSGILESGR
ncbi:endolytic transglycosylase MltG [Antrihabitans cavernicola]|uniref:Endolytic murein transglycosylase n=1 Tax=Antrihabitans cavernicola TaxID=2495913 RepID=A0A5A7SD75_9NOCA|nr:endolytic transglycosylase MltG [Spelaeibacter cavernicola]KAA0023504.1 endolytic transglycosylase MltG [Spelaeibacter cavernicola]